MDGQLIFTQLAEFIQPLYLVGGGVRDKLLGLKPKDFDFATPLDPDEIERRAKAAGKKVYTTGKRFGTVGVRLSGQTVEITTFRSESYQPGSRKPTVKFVDNITYDLSRRDFTINALAMKLDGSIIDPFGGHNDLAKKIIRTVGNASERFSEDPLRMLRAIRFAAQLDFNLASETKLRISKRAKQILSVSRERWVQELDKLLLSARPEKALELLAATRLINYLLPELAVQIGFKQDSPYHQLELWPHTLKTVRLSQPELNLRWAALLHDVGKPYVKTVNRNGYSNYVDHEIVGAELVLKIGHYLRWSNQRLKTVHDLVLDHLKDGSPLNKADAAATKAD